MRMRALLPALGLGDDAVNRRNSAPDAVLARRVAETDVAGRTERAARHRRDVRLLEKEERDVLVGRERLALVHDAVERATVREGVERALRHAALHARDRAKAL